MDTLRSILDWLGRYLSREFLMTVAFLWMVYALAMAGKLTTEVVAAIGPVMMYVWGRTKQKADGAK